MSTDIALVVFAVGIIALFVLDRDAAVRTSPALWLPVLWVSLSGSRMVSQWLGTTSPVESAAQVLDGNSLDRNIQIVMMVAALFVLIARHKDVNGFLATNAPILVFFCYCGISVAWSDYPVVAFKRWFKAVGDLMMILVVVTDPDSVGAMKRFLGRIGFLLIPASILLIKYYPALGQVYSGAEGHVRYTGVAMDKNMLGVVCLISGLGAIWRLIDTFRQNTTTRVWRHRLAQAVLLTMVLWLLLKANSLTSLACFGLAAILMIVTSIPLFARKQLLVHLLILAMLGVASSALFLGSGGSLVEAMGRDSTLTGRTDLWKLLVGMGQNPLFGTGFESFWLGERLEKIWAIYWWHPNESHNGYLEVFLNLGGIGVALLLGIIVSGYVNAFRRFRLDTATANLKLAFLVGTVAYGFTEAAFRVLSPVWVLFLLSAMGIPKAVGSPAKVARQAEPHGDGRPRLDGARWRKAGEFALPSQASRIRAPFNNRTRSSRPLKRS